MSLLTDRLSRPRPRTETELRSILGKPIDAPCPICGSAIFAVRHVGGLICIGCHWDEAHDRRITAFWVTAVLRPDGTTIAIHHGEDAGYRDAPVANLPALAGVGLAGGGGGGAAARPSAVRPDGSWDWDLCIPIERALGPNPDAAPASLAASWVNCQFCGTPTLHRSGVCYVCRKKRGL